MDGGVGGSLRVQHGVAHDLGDQQHERLALGGAEIEVVTEATNRCSCDRWCLDIARQLELEAAGESPMLLAGPVVGAGHHARGSSTNGKFSSAPVSPKIESTSPDGRSRPSVQPSAAARSRRIMSKRNPEESMNLSFPRSMIS